MCVLFSKKHQPCSSQRSITSTITLNSSKNAAIVTNLENKPAQFFVRVNVEAGARDIHRQNEYVCIRTLRTYGSGGGKLSSYRFFDYYYFFSVKCTVSWVSLHTPCTYRTEKKRKKELNNITQKIFIFFLLLLFIRPCSFDLQLSGIEWIELFFAVFSSNYLLKVFFLFSFRVLLLFFINFNFVCSPCSRILSLCSVCSIHLSSF